MIRYLFLFFFFQLKGSIDDCSCNVDTVDYFNNNKIYPRLKSLLVRDFFRFYKINLKKDCPFWTDDSKCAMRTCHVMMCEDKDLPDGFKKHSDSETAAYKVCVVIIILLLSNFPYTVNGNPLREMSMLPMY